MKLFKHQEEVLNQTEGKNKVAYYLDMGLGKTFVGSEKAISLGKDVLVVCQKSKINDWINHFKDNYPYGVGVMDLTNKNTYRSFVSYLDRPCEYIFVYVINYELAWHRPELLNLKDFTLMLDESSLIQNSKAKQTKFIMDMKPSNVILLSGTPVSGKYENLWTQCKLLGWDIDEKLFTQHYVQYDYLKDKRGRKKINPVTNRPIKVVVGYKNEDRLNKKLKDYGAIFMKTEEVFDLPSKNYIDIKIDITPNYKKFMKNGIVSFNGIDLIGNTPLTKRLYARMLCGQYNKAKLDVVKDLLSSTNDRFLIFYNFNEELDQLINICDELNRPYSQINGSVKDLTSYEEETNSITLCHYRAASKGLNLQKANKIIYFTPTDRVEDWMQSQKRIHRIGQESPCFYYLMKCSSSVEESIYKALEMGVDYTDELFKKDYM